MKNFPKTGIAVFLLVMLLLFSGCGKAGYSAGSPVFYDELPQAAPVISMESARMAGAGFNAASPPEQVYAGSDYNDSTAMSLAETGQSRKLVKRAELRIRVEDLQSAEKPLADLITKYNAWTASTGIYENSRNYSIRVPAGFYDQMLSELVNLGKILRRTENAEDVTLRYYDLESRLQTKRELLKTYQGYLAKAANIDEIMTVEGRIADLQLEIDQTGTQFRNLASLIDYSTINVDIQGPANTSLYSEPTFGEKLAELFGSFGDTASSVLVIIIGIIIYGIPAVLVVVLLFWVLFGRIGLLKKLWRLAAGKKHGK